jgi:hypothetical protein
MLDSISGAFVEPIVSGARGSVRSRLNLIVESTFGNRKSRHRRGLVRPPGPRHQVQHDRRRRPQEQVAHQVWRGLIQLLVQERAVSILVGAVIVGLHFEGAVRCSLEGSRGDRAAVYDDPITELPVHHLGGLHWHRHRGVPLRAAILHLAKMCSGRVEA